MMQRILLVVAVVLAALIVADVLDRSPSATAGPAVVDAPATVVSGPRRAAVEIAPGTMAAPEGTPSIDLYARLAIRQRIDREGNGVYLDSMLAIHDSTVVRWPDDRRDRLTVRFHPDTTVRGWSGAVIDDARAALRAWDDNGAGLVLRETDDSVADIHVRWTELLDSTRTGLTRIEWSTDGVIRQAHVLLALKQPRDSALIPPVGRRRVALHEFGHALGLPHSSRDDDAMFTSSPLDRPSRRDLATLLLLYAVPHGPLRTP